MVQKLLLTFILIAAAPVLAQSNRQTLGDKAREKIGEVFEKPVYRDQLHLQAENSSDLSKELLRIFAAPVLEQYRKSHARELEPTAEELDKAEAYFKQERLNDPLRIGGEDPLEDLLDELTSELSSTGIAEERRLQLLRDREELKKQIDGQDRSMAQYFLEKWKWERHLYEKFGRGRVLFQQAGLEAFDAMHNWLKYQEEKRNFTITDPALRVSFYSYWTSDQGNFLSNTKDAERALLEPPWSEQPETPAGNPTGNPRSRKVPAE